MGGRQASHYKSIGRVSHPTILMQAVKESLSLSNTEIRAFSSSEYEAWLINTGWEIMRIRLKSKEVAAIEEAQEEHEVGEAYIGEQRASKTNFMNDRD